MLKQTINEKMKNFMRAKDKIRLTAIRGINADIKNKEIDIKRELTEDEVISVIEKSIKQYNETLEFAQTANDQAKIDEINICIDLLSKFMPEQLTDAEARVIIKTVIEENGFEGKKDMGKAMKEIMPKLKGRFNSKKVSQVVGEILK